MEITIRHKTENRIIVEGEFSSIREAAEKNSANLQGADLQGADLRDAKIKTTQTESIIESLGTRVEP